MGQGSGHADHLCKADDGTEDHSCKVEPVRMQPVICKSAESVTEEDCRRNDETYLGVASRGNQGIGLGCAFWIVGHDEVILT
jgi:hypothetical protein